jgi:anti-sigma B factor antagonist
MFVLFPPPRSWPKQRAKGALPRFEAVMSGDLLTIAVVPKKGNVTLCLTGEIDMSSAESIRDTALSAMQRHGTTVHVDLSAVTFMDSTGLQALLALRRRVELSGGSLRLVGPTHTVMRILDVTGVMPLFEIVTTSEAEAVPDRRAVARSS